MNLRPWVPLVLAAAINLGVFFITQNALRWANLAAVAVLLGMAWHLRNRVG